MHRLPKLWKRNPSEIALFARVSLLVWAIRVGLWILPFPMLRKLVAHAIGDAGKDADMTSKYFEATPETQPVMGRLKWAVQAASRYVPEATCLTQALAMQILLARQGYASDVHIGVAKGEAGKFEAHAWVESRGQVLIGGRGVERWTPLTTLKAHQS